MRLNRTDGWIARCGWVSLGIVLSVAGCGGSNSSLARVTGVVMLDGKPLPEAVVTFQPPGGSPSEGITDKEGVYRLKYTHDKTGATVGNHTVRISTSRSDEDDRGETIVVKEVVPARYNQRSELTAEVKPGRNAIDFSLTSSGNTAAAPQWKR